MNENFTVKNGAFNTLYVDIPVYYRSKIDDNIETNIATTVRAFPQEQVKSEAVTNLLACNNKFITNYVASNLEVSEEAKDRVIRTLSYKDMLQKFSSSTIYDILIFYKDVTNSFIEDNRYRKDIEQAKLALTCFNVLATHSKQFIDLMNVATISYSKKTEQFDNEQIKILFRIKDAELKNDFYLQWLSVLENSIVTKIGLKVHEELLTFCDIIKNYQIQYTNSTSDNDTKDEIIAATISLLTSAEYLYNYVEVNTYTKLLELSRKISTSLRLLERVFGLSNYATTKSDNFKCYIIVELIPTEKILKKKDSLGFNLIVDARLGIDGFISLWINAMAKQVKFEIDQLIDVSSPTIQRELASFKLACDSCQKTLNSLSLNIAYNKAIYAILSTVSLFRLNAQQVSYKNDFGDYKDVYTMSQSILCYAEQTEDTIYTTRATNGLIEEFGEHRIQLFVKDIVQDQFALARIKAMLNNIDNQKSANYLHNMLYSTLRITEPEFYQSYIKTYDLINVDDVLDTAGKYDIIKYNKDIIEQNMLALFISDNLFWLDEYLDDLSCDCNVFEAYDRGMQAFYEKYPYTQNFFKTFYSFYIVGVMAYLLKDLSIPLQVLSSAERFNIEAFAKKLRRVIIAKKQEEEQAAKQAEFNRIARQREEERKKQQELEAQRLAEQKAAEEQERRKQIDSEEANKIMEELNKNAWAGFTVPQQQAAYIRYLQEGNSPLIAANLVKDEFVRRQAEEEKLLAQWEQEAKEEERLKQLELEAIAEQQLLAEEARKEEERKAYKALCDKADKQYEDMRAGRAIFPNVLLSEEEQKKAPLLNIYEIAKLFPEMTTAQKLMKKVYEAPSDVLAVDIISAELIRMNEIKANQIIDPIDKEVMSSAKALANKHCVPYDRFIKLTELGMPVEQALIIPPDRLVVLTKMYKADKIVYDRKGCYVVCKGEYIVPVSYKELRELYIKQKKIKGDSNE